MLKQSSHANGRLSAPQFSEGELATRFSDSYARDLRYTAKLGQWRRWDGTRWCLDDTLEIYDLVRQLCREVSAECDSGRAHHIYSGQNIASIERIARSDRRTAATVAQWDSNSWLLNTPDGIVDLKTGELRLARRQDYMTKVTAVGPSNDPAELWFEFLLRVTDGDTEKMEFLQQIAGYSLTGDTSEQVFFFLYGTGGNGKDTYVTTVANLLGDYAATAHMATFVATGYEQHPTDLASLMGARLVTVTELEPGARWAEGKVKNLTGGSKVTARFMRQDFFSYVPQFKLLFAANDKPQLRSVDEAMRRRLRLIPFNVVIPEGERCKDLGQKLRAEWPAILHWAIEGCLDWQQRGLLIPQSVREATEEYFSSEDILGKWIEERCTVGNRYHAAVDDLFRDWRWWARGNEEPEGSKKSFTQKLVARGFEAKRSNRQRMLGGLKLAHFPQPE